MKMKGNQLSFEQYELQQTIGHCIERKRSENPPALGGLDLKKLQAFAKLPKRLQQTLISIEKGNLFALQADKITRSFIILETVRISNGHFKT